MAAIAILVGAYRLMEAFAFGPTMMRDEVPIWGWIVLASPVIVVLGASVGVLWSKRLRSFGIGALTSVGLTFVVGVLFG